MSRERKAIRHRIRALLIGKTPAGTRVFSSPTTSAWEGDLPQIHIFPRAEDFVEIVQAPLTYKREFNLAVEIIAKSTKDADLADLLDDMAETCEELIMDDDSLGLVVDGVCLVDRVVPNGVEFEYQGEGETPMGSVRLIYTVTYTKAMPRCAQDQAAAGLTDLKGVDAEWKIGHHDEEPDNVVEAEDKIDF